MDDVHAFLDAAEAFFAHIAAVAWIPLAIAVVLHVLKLALRVRAWQNIVRASYPDTRVPYSGIFGAYVAGVGVNSVAPARGGDLVKLYLARRRVGGSTYPTLASSLLVETLFDFVVATVLFLWALQAGVLPGVPDLPSLPAFDWKFAVDHPAIAAFVGGALVFAALVGWRAAARRVHALRERVALGFAALRDRRAFVRGVVSWQALSWVARLASVWFFLDAFHIEPGVATVLTVVVVQSLSTLLPFTPGGAGTQQAVLVFALAGTASGSAVLSFSVGMQLVTVAANVLLGFGAIGVMLRTLHWRRHVAAARETAPPTFEGAPVPERAAAPERPALRG